MMDSSLNTCGMPEPMPITRVHSSRSVSGVFSWRRADRLGCGRRMWAWASRNRYERSFDSSRPASSRPPKATLKPIGKPAKNDALCEFRR